MLDFRMKTFLTIYREMNYRKTAELLNMTQPGVTQHIHYLENYYGVKLFEYNGKTLSRTKNAEILKRHIDSMMAEEHAMIDEFSQKELPALNVGATKTIGEFVLPSTVRNYLAHSRNHLNFVIDNTGSLLKQLENSDLDFAVIEGVFDKSRFAYHLYKKERFVGICSANHPFAGKSVSLQNVFKETLLIREEGSGTRRLLEQAVADKGFSLEAFSRVVSLGSFSLISDIAETGKAITFAYEPVALQRNSLATFQVKDMRIRGEFNFVYCNEHIAREKISLFFHPQN